MTSCWYRYCWEVSGECRSTTSTSWTQGFMDIKEVESSHIHINYFCRPLASITEGASLIAPAVIQHNASNVTAPISLVAARTLRVSVPVPLYLSTSALFALPVCHQASLVTRMIKTSWIKCFPRKAVGSKSIRWVQEKEKKPTKKSARAEMLRPGYCLNPGKWKGWRFWRYIMGCQSTVAFDTSRLNYISIQWGISMHVYELAVCKWISNRKHRQFLRRTAKHLTQL